MGLRLQRAGKFFPQSSTKIKIKLTFRILSPFLGKIFLKMTAWNRIRMKESGPLRAGRCILGSCIALIACAAYGFLAVALAQESRAWNYPGVPYTDWEYDPFTYGPPPTPTEWPNAAKVGYYRVEPDNPAASDAVLAGEPVDANGKRYGYPARPRLTLPLISKNGNSFPAGTVFWMKGGTYDTMVGTGEIWNMSCVSTPEAPFRIYGDPTDPPKLLNGRIVLFNSAYGFVDNIIWDAGNKGAGCIGFASPFGEGPTHHIAVRNCTIKNRVYVSNSGFIDLAARGSEITDGDIHDIVCYKLNIHACGYGVDWNAVDADMHGYKINGKWEWTYPDGVPTEGEGNRVYRIWIIENTVTPGTEIDPLDGLKKGLAGSFVQVGDQKISEGNTDHVYVAGCVIEGVRQSSVGFKRSADCVVSSNVTIANVKCATAQGQAYNFKYDRQDNLWVINNFVKDVDAFVIRAETTAGYGESLDTFDKLDTRVYIVGNVFKDCMRTPWSAPDVGGIGGRKSKGICVQDFNGKVYIMNNVVDGSPYGAYFGTSGTRQSIGSEMHVYNNVFMNLSAGPDTSTAANNGICVINATDTKWYMENNFTDSGRNYYEGVQYNTDAAFDARADAAGNRSGDPLFTDAERENYTPKNGSPLIDAGLKITTLAPTPVDIYQLFNDAFANDPDFPGNPADVWPRDRNDKPRFQGKAIDIGPVEAAETTGGAGMTKPTGLEIVMEE